MTSRMAISQRRKVARLYQDAGIKVAAIAQRFGISQGLVSKIADEFHLPKRRPGRTYGNLFPDCGGIEEHRIVCRPLQKNWICQTYRGAW